MFANARIFVRSKDAVVVPITAVSMSGNGADVMKVQDGRVATRPVKTGIVAGDKIEIVSGLGAGDQIVAKAGAFVRDGDSIHPVPLEGASNRVLRSRSGQLGQG